MMLNDERLIEAFKESFPAWTENIDRWEPIDKDTIKVFMKTGEFFNSGQIYIFGDEGRGELHLTRLM